MSGVESSIPAERSEPVRTCVGCRRTSEKSHLLRVVLVDGVVTADADARLAGRGAYVHRTSECLTQAEQRRAFRRAFRLDAAPAVSEELRAAVSTTQHAGA